MSSSYRLTLDNWLRSVDVKAHTVLDIGGSQLQLPSRVKSWDVDNYIIADLPEPHKDSQKPDIQMDLNKFFAGMGTYDMIFCLEVFDYIYDPMMAMNNIAKQLDTDGIAWVTFPSVYPLHQPVEDDALRYMPGGIKKLAESAGLTIEEMIPRRFETNLWDRTFREERMRAAKGVDHNFSGWICRFKK